MQREQKQKPVPLKIEYCSSETAEWRTSTGRPWLELAATATCPLSRALWLARCPPACHLTDPHTSAVTTPAFTSVTVSFVLI